MCIFVECGNASLTDRMRTLNVGLILFKSAAINCFADACCNHHVTQRFCALEDDFNSICVNKLVDKTADSFFLYAHPRAHPLSQTAALFRDELQLLSTAIQAILTSTV